MAYREAIAAAVFVIAAVFAGESSKGATPDPKEAVIPFVNSGSIRDWSADGREAIYIQDVHGQWYHAKLMSSCTDLPFTETIGFETRGTDTLEKFGTIIVRHGCCPIQSLVKRGPHPSKAKQHKQVARQARPQTRPKGKRGVTNSISRAWPPNK